METLRLALAVFVLADLTGCSTDDHYWESRGGPPDNLPDERSTGVTKYAIATDDKGKQSFEPTGEVYYPPGTY